MSSTGRPRRVATSRIGAKSLAVCAFAPMLEALMLAGTVADALRPRWALLAEIALLRHQLVVLQRSMPSRV